MSLSRNWSGLTAAVFATAAFASSAQAADRNAQIESLLKEFDLNPAAVMDRQLPKMDINGITVRVERPEIATVEMHDRVRRELLLDAKGVKLRLKDIKPGKAPIENADHADNLVDNAESMLTTLDEMESLKTAKLTTAPWSDDYWPIYKGILGARYADSKFEDVAKSKDYNDIRKYVDEQEDIFSIIGGMGTEPNSTSIDALSPSEKYDLLIGDANGSLTKTMWAQGKSYADSNGGKVETWMGICHGWAPAAYMELRPKAMIAVTAADGRTQINFYPADIKALASLLWAQTNPPSRFIGGRCDDKKPAKDASGRVISEECFDTNPGSWHKAVVNQIGKSDRSLVIDATFDYEVWNQPVYSYKYTYFNPQTRRPVGSLERATIALKDFTKDKFKAHRHAAQSGAVSVVGIAMDMTYVVETTPSHILTDAPENDKLETVRYLYDLELNAQGEIVGGEWYTNKHPDFLWTPAPDTQARSAGDRLAAGEWNGEGAMPEAWTRAAAAAARQGQPLAKIVKALTARAFLGK